MNGLSAVGESEIKCVDVCGFQDYNFLEIL